jgi:uncharacterized protein YndB with AHSA1/START domain
MKHDFLYSVEREYIASMADVWHAWTDAAALESWYHPADLANLPGSSASDVRVGGRWSIAVDVPQYSMVAYFYGLYTAIDEHKKLTHTMCYTQDAAEFAAKDDTAPHHIVEVDFEDRNGKVWVKFSQFGEMPAEQIPQTQAGMESYFDSLEGFLAK